MKRLRTRNAAETLRLGRWIGERLPPGAVVGLDGDLGAGKTWTAKGMVRGIGEFDDELVKSPAYNLVHEYPVAAEGGAVPVFHLDFYRLDELSDTDFFLFSEYFETPGAVFLVEWAERFLAELAPAYLSIRLSLCDGDDPDCRDLEVTVVGETDVYRELLAELEAAEREATCAP